MGRRVLFDVGLERGELVGLQGAAGVPDADANDVLRRNLANAGAGLADAHTQGVGLIDDEAQFARRQRLCGARGEGQP
jgi:hypothetical protein